MKISIPMKELKDALVRMSKVIYGKTNLPVLGGVKITGTESGVTLTGTNLEETLTCIILNETKSGGSFIINLKELKDYLKTGGSSGTVQFEDVGNRIAGIFHAGNVPAIRQFNSIPLDDWPELPPLPLRRAQINENVFATIRAEWKLSHLLITVMRTELHGNLIFRNTNVRL